MSPCDFTSRLLCPDLHIIRAMYQLLWRDVVEEAARAVGKRLLACEPTLSSISNRLQVCADVMNAGRDWGYTRGPRLDDLASPGPNQHLHSVVIPLNYILPSF